MPVLSAMLHSMTGAEVTSTVFSAVALVLAIISLIWQILRARADRPQLDITGWHGYTVYQEDWAKAVWLFRITVTNVGREAVTIDNVGWRNYSAGGPVLVSGGDISATTPLRLEGNDSHTWEFEAAVYGTLWEGLRGCASIEYVRRPGLLGRLRKHSSRRTLNGEIQTYFVPQEAKDRAAQALAAKEVVTGIE